MADSTFIYVTYIRTTPKELWRALTTTEFMAQYWLGAKAEAEWRKGGPWKLVFPDGRVADQGEIVDFEPERLLAIKWRNEWSEEFKAEGWSMCTMAIETMVNRPRKAIPSHFSGLTCVWLRATRRSRVPRRAAACCSSRTTP